MVVSAATLRRNSSGSPSAQRASSSDACADAFKAHQASPHFEGIAVAQIRPLLAERRLEVRRVVEPDGDAVR